MLKWTACGQRLCAWHCFLFADFHRPLILKNFLKLSIEEVPEKKHPTDLFNRALLDETVEKRLSRIPRRLKNSVTQLDILNWLDNFKAQEYDYALSILEALEYVFESELVEFLEQRLTTLFSGLVAGQKLYIIPIADYGKSSKFCRFLAGNDCHHGCAISPYVLLDHMDERKMKRVCAV